MGIEAPDPAGRSVARYVELKDQALATSGNYRQFKPAPGGLASHIIDPATRRPVIRPSCSVSVIANDCATADAWATVLFVLGEKIPARAGNHLDNGWENQKIPMTSRIPLIGNFPLIRG